MSKKLKPTHYDVLSRLASRPDSTLRRLSGGFWTDDLEAVEYQQGDWSTTGMVVTALHAGGLIVESGAQEFVLTTLGAEALKTGVYPC